MFCDLIHHNLALQPSPRYDLRERETSSHSSRDPGSRLAGSVSFRVDRQKLHNDGHEQTEIGNTVLECDWVVLFEPGQQEEGRACMTHALVSEEAVRL